MRLRIRLGLPSAQALTDRADVRPLTCARPHTCYSCETGIRQCGDRGSKFLSSLYGTQAHIALFRLELTVQGLLDYAGMHDKEHLDSFEGRSCTTAASAGLQSIKIVRNGGWAGRLTAAVEGPVSCIERNGHQKKHKQADDIQSPI